MAELRYELPKVYAHHRQQSVDIEVDLWYFEPPEDGVVGGHDPSDSEGDEEDDSEGDSDDDWGVEREGARARLEVGIGGSHNAPHVVDSPHT